MTWLSPILPEIDTYYFKKIHDKNGNYEKNGLKIK
jgi:hypothetical protein